MPYFVVQRIMEALNDQGKTLKGADILVLGIAYKKNIDDNRESPAMKIIQILTEKGARVSYNDPHIPRCAGMRHYPGVDITSVELTAARLAAADCVVLVTDHDAYDYPWLAQHARLIVDTRNAFKGIKAPHIYPA